MKSIGNLKQLILLDCGSTVHIFTNPSMVSKIRKAKFPLYLGTNNGINCTTKEATFMKMTVWFNSKTISNVLSYALLTDTGRVVGDSAEHPSIFY